MDLGLKIDHLDLVKNLLTPQLDGDWSVQKTTAYDKAMSDIFVTKSDLQFTHPWYIYCTGHGEFEAANPGLIVSLPIAMFKRMLQFFNQQLNMKFLMYDSCFGGGKNAQEAFEIIQTRGEQQAKAIDDRAAEFNFTIVSGSSSDDITVAEELLTFFTDKIVTHDGKQLPVPDLRQDFCSFFNDLQAYFQGAPAMNLGDIINKVHPFKEGGGHFNIPMIRFAHTEWFSVAGVDKSIIAITDIMVNKMRANKQGTLTIGPDKKVVFLYAKHIPLTLELLSNPLVLSALPGDASHYIKNMKVGTAYNIHEQLLPAAQIDLYVKDLLIDTLTYRAGFAIPEKIIKNLVIFKGPLPKMVFEGIKTLPEQVNGFIHYHDRAQNKTLFGVREKEKGTWEFIEADPTRQTDFNSLVQEIKKNISEPSAVESEGIEARSLATYSKQPLVDFLKKRVAKKP